MTINIKTVGMEKGSQYETIITTLSNDGTRNAAPIGTIAYSKDEIMCRIFITSHTARNIINQREFVVNITSNPILFTLSTIGNLPEEYFTDDKIPALKDCDAYLKCKVKTLKEARKKNDPVAPDAKSVVIKAEVYDIVFNTETPKIANRGFYMLIESLVNYTRLGIVDDKLRDYYLDRFLEDERVIRKVGTSEDKKSIEILRNQLTKEGYTLKKFN